MSLLRDLYLELDLRPEQMDYEGRITRRGDTVRMLDGKPLCAGCLITARSGNELAATILGERKKTDIEAFAAQMVEPGLVAYGIRFKDAQ
jgi:hypothetical protein